MQLCECGCGQPTKIATRNRYKLGQLKGKPLRFINGHAGKCPDFHPNVSHGMTGSPEYGAWHNAKDRCTRTNHKQYPHYGGRGIQFLFKSFDEFFAELGPRPTPFHSVDRINNDGHYQAGNIRWATRSQQQRNRKPVHLTPQQRKQISDRRKAGESARTIADDFDTSVQYVYFLSNHDWQFPGARKRSA